MLHKRQKKTAHDVLRVLTLNGPMTGVEIAEVMECHIETVKKWLRSLCYADEAYWCGHQIDRSGHGRHPRLYVAGASPSDALYPVPSTRPKRRPRDSINDDAPPSRVVVAALHPMLAWGVAA